MRHDSHEFKVGGDVAKLHTYLLDNPMPEIAKKRPIIVICPGGGYARTSDREAEPIALRFNAAGFHAVVLRYSCAPAKYPTALLQLAQAVAFVRDMAAGWDGDPDRIFVAGFSAGGHLAAHLGTVWNKFPFRETMGADAEQVKPRGLILSYPVITSGEFKHAGSISNLYGEDLGLAAQNSLEQLVDASTPPTFLWHTAEDEPVPVENSLLFAAALRRHGVRFELHIYPAGAHGLSLATPEVGVSDPYPTVPGWIDLAINFVNET